MPSGRRQPDAGAPRGWAGASLDAGASATRR